MDTIVAAASCNLPLIASQGRVWKMDLPETRCRSFKRDPGTEECAATEGIGCIVVGTQDSKMEILAGKLCRIRNFSEAGQARPETLWTKRMESIC